MGCEYSSCHWRRAYIHWDSRLVDYFSWHAGFIGPGISLIIITIAGFRFLQDRPETSRASKCN